MTTIVWDGKTLAADGRMTAYNKISEDDRAKILVDGVNELRGGTVICYAVAGAADMTHRIGEWIAEGCPPKAACKDTAFDFSGASFEVIIVTTDSVFEYNSGSNDILELFSKTCLGSGGEFAQVPLFQGKDAKACVKLAAQIDLFSGGIGTFINCRTKKMVLKEFKV